MRGTRTPDPLLVRAATSPGSTALTHVEQEERPLVPSRSVPLMTVPHRDLGTDLGTGSPWRTAHPPIDCGRTRQVSLTVHERSPVWSRAVSAIPAGEVGSRVRNRDAERRATIGDRAKRPPHRMVTMHLVCAAAWGSGSSSLVLATYAVAGVLMSRAARCSAGCHSRPTGRSLHGRESELSAECV